MARTYPDMSKVKIGTRLKFRNGGVSKVREVGEASSKFYPISIRLNNFHAQNMSPWSYDERGFCGEGTGRGHVCPFDIIEILK